VIPGVLLVGAYPASDDDEDTFELITSILKQGVSKFVCLQSEVSANSLFCMLREAWSVMFYCSYRSSWRWCCCAGCS
jgi:hypothetical protein